MNPVSAASAKIGQLRYQLSGHTPDAQVVMTDKTLKVGIPLRSNKQPDQQELRTHLLGLSRELKACLDDFLHVDSRSSAMDLLASLGNGPVTVQKLNNALEAAEMALNSISYPTAATHLVASNPVELATGTTESSPSGVSQLKTLAVEVEAARQSKAKGFKSLSNYEVLAMPPNGNADPSNDLKVKKLGIATEARQAKRRGLQSYVSNLANQIGHEILANRPDRNDPHYADLIAELQIFAALGKGGPVSPSEFVSAANRVLDKADTAGQDDKLFNDFKDPCYTSTATFEKVRATPLYQSLFGPGNSEHPIIRDMQDRAGDPPRHFRLKRVVDCMEKYGITPEEALAVWIYSVSWKPLNASCRRGTPLQGRAEILIGVESALQKLRAPVTGVLFRGVDSADMPTSKLRQLTTVGSTYFDAAVTSTSFDPQRIFNGDLTVVITPSDDSAGSSILPLSGNPQEKEILYPPYTRFSVTAVTADSAGKITSVQLSELPRS